MQDPKEAREDVEFHRTDGRTVDGAPVKTAAKARQASHPDACSWSCPSASRWW